MPETEESKLDRIDCIRMQVGVNMGDHAETTWHSFDVGDDETVRDLMERLIPSGDQWRPRDYDNWVRLSFVEPRNNLTGDGHATEGPF